ncbi:hypothetical protein [Nonomuraea jiangxiensis]|uniref:Uncharacterized protein n=1 Tax=Nonomuraea jiangxiensis TaxID=633440 RepID=A0A1G8N923_9ACTN|nr:hypothetical protein [Nonomuraea jiangxiensis]SDI76692.1 hypothetical protein SAMN05421869_10753 [Nonomuraea jiangxiensis]
MTPHPAPPAAPPAVRSAVPPVLTAVVTTAALALAGCVATEPATTASTPVPEAPAPPPSAVATTATREPAALDPGTIDQRDADAVSAAVLTAMWSIDTTTDRDQRDAVLRAAGWLTPAYLADLRTGPQVGTDAAWAAWAAQRAHTRPAITAGHDARPPDTATHADRQWQLTVTPIGADGRPGRPLTMTAFVALQRRQRSAPWRVSAVTLR